jgi:ABC-type phosphate transport system auxiliary subunit
MDAFKQKAKDMFTTREAALGAAAVVASAAGMYFFWPAAVAAGVTMKAPGAAGFLISRAAFVANPQLYFQILRTAGAAAAAAALAL